jgi:hypothetical protein
MTPLSTHHLAHPIKHLRAPRNTVTFPSFQPTPVIYVFGTDIYTSYRARWLRSPTQSRPCTTRPRPVLAVHRAPASSCIKSSPSSHPSIPLSHTPSTLRTPPKPSPTLFCSSPLRRTDRSLSSSCRLPLGVDEAAALLCPFIPYTYVPILLLLSLLDLTSRLSGLGEVWRSPSKGLFRALRRRTSRRPCQRPGAMPACPRHPVEPPLASAPSLRSTLRRRRLPHCELSSDRVVSVEPS